MLIAFDCSSHPSFPFLMLCFVTDKREKYNRSVTSCAALMISCTRGGRYLNNNIEDSPIEDEGGFLATVKEDYLQKRYENYTLQGKWTDTSAFPPRPKGLTIPSITVYI